MKDPLNAAHDDIRRLQAAKGLDLTTAERAVIAERRRQIDGEGWTAEHDDTHTDGSLALAAVCYVTPIKLFAEVRNLAGGPAFFDPWPLGWSQRWDKRFRYGERRTNPGNVVPDPVTYTPVERRDLLVKGAAMIIAEIERLDRLEASSAP